VRFAAEAEPIGVRACWCRDCQYWSCGSASVNVLFPSDRLTVSGEMTDFASDADSGSHMHRKFCPTCGTPLLSTSESRPYIVIVRAGALDDPEIAAPQGYIWTDSKPSWAHIDPDLPCVAGQPPPPPAPSGS